jgi:hypothetical protein
MSYLTEGLECHVAGLFKAVAVMVGCATESLILNLRDVTVEKLTALGNALPTGIEDRKIKTVSDTLCTFFEAHRTQIGRDLWEPFEANWSTFAQQMRAVRNDAGHPKSVEPVTSDTAHASLLVFPELAKIATGLARWVAEDLR